MKKYMILIFPILLIIYNSIFTLNEVEQAIIVQFGKPIGEPISDAGIHFKVPLIQQIHRFDKRILQWDGAANEMPTKDNKYIFIDVFARWRISDPLIFYKAAKNEIIAQSLLDDIIDGAVRDEISNRAMAEIIRYSDRKIDLKERENDQFNSDEGEKEEYSHKGARLKIIDSIELNVSNNLKDLNMGIKIIDVQLKRINYNQEVKKKVFQRMISGQNRIAEKYRAQGEGKKQEILGTQMHKKKEILSNAYLNSQKIRGEADAKATKIYADTYGRSSEFYNFLKSLETYERTIDSTSTLILSTDNAYLKYLNKK